MRAAAAGHAGNRPVATAAIRELNELFPEIAAKPLEAIGIFYHFDHWVEALFKGLDKACTAAGM